jgi:hypothetical protein
MLAFLSRTACALAFVATAFVLAEAPAAQAQTFAGWPDLTQAEYVEKDTPEGRRWMPEFPSEVEALDGEVVVMQGYMIPLSYEDEQLHFLISAFPGHGCFFHLPGGPAAVAEVQATSGVGFTFDQVAVEGRLELLHDDPYGLLYRLVEAKPAER